ncbi:MAG: hypothetical protein P8P30_02340 [Rickettsiales bacterium]|nr:hypothetical protein [Rickettsiales bacterium]
MTKLNNEQIDESAKAVAILAVQGLSMVEQSYISKTSTEKRNRIFHQTYALAKEEITKANV